MDQVNTSVVEVTPKMAREWLARDTGPQRQVTRYVQAYARDMRDGAWRINGETLILGSDGRVLDGRKRLMACMEADTSFVTVLADNVDAGSFDTINAQRARKAPDFLFIRREEHYRTLSAVLNLVLKYYQGLRGGSRTATPRDTLFVLDLRPEIRESVAQTSGLGRLGWHTVAAATHHLASRVDRAKADVFFHRLVSGETYGENDPAAHLRRAFEGSTGAGQTRMMALAIRAWNAEYLNKPLKVLRWRQEGDKPEPFPMITGLEVEDAKDLLTARKRRNATPVDPADLTVQLERITPARAEELLRANTANRNIVSSVVDKYARDMMQGYWAINGQTIKLSRTGRLLDGQHRCLAAVRSKQSFMSIIVRGLPDDVFDTLDAGPVRSFGEVLARRGEKNATTLAAALQKIWLYRQRTPQIRTVRASHSELLRVLEEEPEIRDCVNHSISRVRGILPGAIGTATHYLGACHFDRELADEFVERVLYGAELKRHDPVLLLRDKMMRDRMDQKEKLSETEKWALSLKAMNAFFQGAEMKLLVWRQKAGEAFPRVIGDEPELEQAA